METHDLILLLLQLILCFVSVVLSQQQNNTMQQAHSDYCEDFICYITPNNFLHLQNIIHSNKMIVLDGKIFNAGMVNTIIVIENVSNLMITGQENGSVIECSSESIFGIHMNNGTNVTLANLTIRNCGSAIPNHFLELFNISHDWPCNQDTCPQASVSTETSVLIEASKNVTLSGVHINCSPGYALTVVDSFPMNEYYEPFSSLGNMNPNVKLSDCTISHSIGGSIMMYGTTLLLIEEVVITNSSTGIESSSADIIMKNVDVINCRHSYLERGSVTVRGRLTMNYSSLHIHKERVYIANGKVNFNGDNSHSGLRAIKGEIFVADHSVIAFVGFHLHTSNSFALQLVLSSIEVNDSSTVAFTNNSARQGSSILTLLESQISVSDYSSLVVSHNAVTDSWVILSAFETVWTTTDYAVVDIVQNTASDNSIIAEFNKWDIDSVSVTIEGNTLLNGSVGVYFDEGHINIINKSHLLISNNSASIISDIVSVNGYINHSENSTITIAKNSVRKNSCIVSLCYASNLFIKSKYSYHSVIQAFKEKRSTEESSGFSSEFGSGASQSHPFTVEEEEQPTLTFGQEPSSGSGNGTSPSIPNIFAEQLPTEVLSYYFDEDETLSIDIPPISIWIRVTYIQLWGDLNFQNNTLSEKSIALSVSSCETRMGGKMAFNDNICQSSSHLVFLNEVTICMEKESHCKFTHNEIQTGSSILVHYGGSWEMVSSSTFSVTKNVAEVGYLMRFFSTNITLNTLTLEDNNLSNFGALNFFSSKVWFKGSFYAVGNRAESGAVNADNSDLFFTGNATFMDNFAANGGAMTLISSTMHISPNAVVDFTRNQAYWLGGAIYIFKPRQTYACETITATSTSCSIQVLQSNSSIICQLFSLTFSQNRAGIAGNAIYGGYTSACMPSNREDFCSNCPVPDVSDVFQYNGMNDSSDLSSFTSDPTRVCFCENGIPDCYKVTKNVTVYPGERFTLSLVIVGYGLGTVPGSVIARGSGGRKNVSEQGLFGSELEYSQEIRGIQCQDIGYSIVYQRDKEQIALAVDTHSFMRSEQEVEAVVDIRLAKHTDTIIRSPYDSTSEAFFHIPVFVDVDLLPCPVGFDLVSGRCVCHRILQDNEIHTCSISNGTAVILRPASYWIGLPNTQKSSILLHPHCPFDYCQPDDTNISAESPHSQCQYQRSGVLCGSCREGLSMIFGSSECKSCSNVYLTSISLFILLGIALVILLTLLNMTVSVGSLNGLILFANILQANQSTFLPPDSSHTSPLASFLRAFIAWLNMDLGIPMCFFDGLTTYIKTWLQFVFPLYLMSLVGAIITASRYSQRLTKLFGTNTVSVLATLVLLSYTKILRVLITAFSFTTLTGSQDYHSIVWLADGNIAYFEAKHTILFVVAFLVLLLLGIPYTVTLTAAPWIQRSNCSCVSFLYNRFKPLFDAYMGPYEDRYRYWTGMLLLARVVLIVLFSSISNTNTVAGPQLNLLLLTLSSSLLLALTASLRPYKRKHINGLEIFHLSLLLVISASNLYVSSIGSGTGPRVYIYVVLVGICFLVILGTCAAHIWCKVQTARSTMMKVRGPQEIEREEYYPQWQRGRVRAEAQGSEEVTMSTAAGTNTTSDGEERDLVYRESALELASF